jgi:hypothetical protein
MADDQSAKSSAIDKIILWAAGQPFNNVLLLLILGGGAWLVIDRVPVHLNMIQNGYREVIETVNKQHGEERKEMLENHREERERSQQFYDKLMDRVAGAGHSDWKNGNVSGGSSKVARQAVGE